MARFPSNKQTRTEMGAMMPGGASDISTFCDRRARAHRNVARTGRLHSAQGSIEYAVPQPGACWYGIRKSRRS